jgi:hypothetical protein
VGSRAGLDIAVVTRKIPSPCRESNPGRPARNFVTVLGAFRFVLLCLFRHWDTRRLFRDLRENVKNVMLVTWRDAFLCCRFKLLQLFRFLKQEHRK